MPLILQYRWRLWRRKARRSTKTENKRQRRSAKETDTGYFGEAVLVPKT